MQVAVQDKNDLQTEEDTCCASNPVLYCVVFYVVVVMKLTQSVEVNSETAHHLKHN